VVFGDHDAADGVFTEAVVFSKFAGGDAFFPEWRGGVGFNSNGPLRGIKRDFYEGGIREPFIARWPGKIKPGAVTDHVSGFQDVLPTICDLIGVDIPKTDGVSFLPTLLGKTNQQKQHDYLYWEFEEKGGRRAILKDGWKGVALNTLKTGLDEFELYRIGDDIGETKNLAKQNPKIVTQLKRAMQAAHVDQ